MSNQKEIDWSKAPEGATHYLPETVPWNPCWVKREAENWYTMIDDGHDSRWDIDRDFEEAKHHIIPRPAQWTGEGLPPAGTVCEWKHAGQWLKVKVAYLSDWLIVLRDTRKAGAGLVESEGVEIAIDHWKEDAPVFRPIRTHEQIAAEEREKEVDQMVQRIAENTTGIGIGAAMICAKALHAAGYRKVTT